MAPPCVSQHTCHSTRPPRFLRGCAAAGVDPSRLQIPIFMGMVGITSVCFFVVATSNNPNASGPNQPRHAGCGAGHPTSLTLTELRVAMLIRSQTTRSVSNSSRKSVNTSSSSIRSRRNRGNTLIEILVTIAIIAVLAFIAFSITSKVRAKAKSVLCIHNLRDWSMVFALASQDRNGRLPTPVNWAAISHRPYNPSPSASTPGRSPFVDYWTDDLQQSMQMQLAKRSCPCLKPGTTSTGNTAPTYMMNAQLSRPPHFLEMHESDLVRASSKILFIDGSVGGPLRISDHSEVDLWVKPSAEAHGGKVNAVFADLHVGIVDPKVLLRDWDDMMLR